MSSLRYAIIGTGAIGGYYGARLQQAGCDVHFLLRSDYSAVMASGLRVESVQGDFALPVVNAYRDPAEMPPVDVAIVALKTTQNHRLNELLPALNTNGVVLTLQNGFGVEADIARHLLSQQQPVPTLLGGLCFICSNKVGPGHIRHIDYGRVLIGAHDAANQRCEPTPLMQDIVADFARAKVTAEMTDDLPMARWQKLVWNVPYNGLSVVLNATTEEMMADSGVRSLITTLMEEVVTAGNTWAEHLSPGENRRLPGGIVSNMLSLTETMQPYRTSMKLDYDEGRSLEVEAILGNPLRASQLAGYSPPAMCMLYRQLSFLNASLS
ncbi:MAG: putative 2-dehydropantoate 2-reductase [Cyanobacteria bacterium J06623_5]